MLVGYFEQDYVKINEKERRDRGISIHPSRLDR